MAAHCEGIWEEALWATPCSFSPFSSWKVYEADVTSRACPYTHSCRQLLPWPPPAWPFLLLLSCDIRWLLMVTYGLRASMLLTLCRLLALLPHIHCPLSTAYMCANLREWFHGVPCSGATVFRIQKIICMSPWPIGDVLMSLIMNI